MYQKEFNPPKKMGTAIYEARIFYKEPREDLPDIIKACAYRYDLPIPKSTEERKAAMSLLSYIQVENERVEGHGLNVCIDINGLLTIVDLDSGEATVVDMREVLTVRTRTCKQVLPEEENDD